MASATATTGHVYHLGAVKPWVANAADVLGNMFDFTNIGGWRAQGSVPDSDHPKGLALDFMTMDQNKANALIQYAQANYAALGITYIIYQRRIWEPKTGWKAYHGPNPHTDHVHISFSSSGGSGTLTSNTTTTGATDTTNVSLLSSLPIIGQLENISARLTDPDAWKRVGYYLLGIALIIGGLIFLFRKPIEQTAIGAVTDGAVR
jgi:hypothetical protein